MTNQPSTPQPSTPLPQQPAEPDNRPSKTGFRLVVGIYALWMVFLAYVVWQVIG